ncbi:hypothetical protein BraRD5C2_61770 [Bradyrhizobium sp. RD5-C2]|nr:hypothetical protein BraRD5C2_61770 [Bradyrhizobium sp. RD5-C2]
MRPLHLWLRLILSNPSSRLLPYYQLLLSSPWLPSNPSRQDHRSLQLRQSSRWLPSHPWRPSNPWLRLHQCRLSHRSNL